MSSVIAVATRVIVAVGPAAADAAALALAARLAHSSGAELAALFIEDLNLLRLAELPIAFEVGPEFAASRRLTTAGLERAFKQQADDLKRSFTEYAKTFQLRMSFSVVRGLPLPTLLDAAAAEDLVILAGASAGGLPPLSAIDILRDALHRPAPHAARPLVAVVQAGTGAARILNAAQQLARALRSELVLFVVRQDDDGGLAMLVDEWLARSGVRARVELLAAASPRSIGSLIAREKPQALLWPGDGASELAAQANAVLDAVDCPLIIVR